MERSKNKIVFGQRLQTLLDSRGMDRYDLCDALGIRYSTVASWLTAASYPRIDTIDKIAKFFNISRADLVGELPSKEYKISKELFKMLTHLQDEKDTPNKKILHSAISTAALLATKYESEQGEYA